MSDSNGPNKTVFLDALGEYTEVRFQQMRWASKAAACLAKFERKGGDRADVQDGFALGKMTMEDRVADVKRRNRVAGFMGVTTWEETGQGTFTATFDMPAAEEQGAGGAPLGSRLSVARAAIDSYNTAKAGGSLADNPWGADTEEFGVWAENFGDGLADRPPPKERKTRDEDGEDVPEGDAPAKKRGRRKASSEVIAERIQELDEAEAATKQRRGQRALPAPESEKPGWQGERDFHQEPAAEEAMPGDMPPLVH